MTESASNTVKKGKYYNTSYFFKLTIILVKKLAIEGQAILLLEYIFIKLFFGNLTTINFIIGVTCKSADIFHNKFNGGGLQWEVKHC